MRLWHYKIVDVLPRSQLVAQWRELNTIFSGKAQNHILVRYALTEEAKEDLFDYTLLVLAEFARRNYKIRQWEHLLQYFGEEKLNLAKTIYGGAIFETKEIFAEAHDETYLRICYANLLEKFIRGQEDFNEINMVLLKSRVEEEIAKSIRFPNEVLTKQNKFDII